MDIPGMLCHNITGMGGTNLSGGSIQPSKYQNKIHPFPIGNFQLLPVGFPAKAGTGRPGHQNANCCVP